MAGLMVRSGCRRAARAGWTLRWPPGRLLLLLLLDRTTKRSAGAQRNFDTRAPLRVNGSERMTGMLRVQRVQ